MGTWIWKGTWTWMVTWTLMVTWTYCGRDAWGFHWHFVYVVVVREICCAIHEEIANVHDHEHDVRDRHDHDHDHDHEEVELVEEGFENVNDFLSNCDDHV